jgi:hypothetical protein
MTRVEQHTMIGELKDYARFMKGKDAPDFEMFVKRDKDDEDLDELSQRRLESLYETYKTMRPKPKMKNPFEK